MHRARLPEPLPLMIDSGSLVAIQILKAETWMDIMTPGARSGYTAEARRSTGSRRVHRLFQNRIKNQITWLPGYLDNPRDTWAPHKHQALRRSEPDRGIG